MSRLHHDDQRRREIDSLSSSVIYVTASHESEAPTSLPNHWRRQRRGQTTVALIFCIAMPAAIFS